ncbi:MAG: hypothetical protein ACRDDY_14275 [Clostridium sp.]|uniref:hypothetical protein n=1 Tax=Clostridium sp. TaxID=1506 RepID=UPI003EE6FFF2
MEFVLVASLLIVIASIVGVISAKHVNARNREDECLYDKETVDIMKTYCLINDEEYRLMLKNLNEKKIN